MPENSSPATKQDLRELEERMTKGIRDSQKELEERMTKGIRDSQKELEERLTEIMRDMQSELLRGFAAFSQGQTIRLRKVEADQSNLDTALSGRVAAVEQRLLEIELRLGKH